MIGKRTIVKLDVVKSSDITNIVESVTNVKFTSAFNRNVRQFIEGCLQEGNLRTGFIHQQVGDGLVVIFEEANDAHKFSEIVHMRSHEVNLSRLEPAKIWFRVGCATGLLDLETYDGCLHITVHRCEPRAEPHSTLIDSQMYSELSSEFQHHYDIEEIIEGKRHEKIRARRWMGGKNINQRQSSEFIKESEVLDLPNSSSDSFETFVLDKFGTITRRIPRDIKYILEFIEKEEIRMILLPTRTYMMGSNDNKGSSHEKPAHRVEITAFLMSQQPITRAQWKIVATWPIVNRKLREITCRKGSMTSPVVNVSWHDAMEFCDRLSLKTRYNYTLPTEAQWEYACRAGTLTPFSFGDTISPTYANYDSNYSYRSGPRSSPRGYTAPVEDFNIPNRFGLCNMHGQVWEWCLDHWHDNYINAPSNGNARIIEERVQRVIRGGSWKNEPKLCTSTYRRANDENIDYVDNVGFRIVRQIKSNNNNN
jgi:formylglycine-generating enzyme required for sulfatase activity